MLDVHKVLLLATTLLGLELSVAGRHAHIRQLKDRKVSQASHCSCVDM